MLCNLPIEEVDFSTLSWSDPEMVYNNEPLTRVISDIESKFGVKISTKGSSSIEKCPFTSRSLKNNTLEEILSLIEATFSAIRIFTIALFLQEVV